MSKRPNLLDVSRRLSVHTEALTDDNATEVFATLEGGYGREASWKDVLRQRICLLIGRANTGKTCELELLQQRLERDGKFAFLLPLRAVFEKRTLEDLFSLRSELAELQRWSESEDEAVFLLDSIDEADLFHEGAFTECLSVLRRVLGDSRLQRARWVISSRPGSWSSSHVASMVRNELCPDIPRTVVDMELSDGAAHESTKGVASTEVVIAALRPLDRRQARKFLRHVFKVACTEDAESLAQNLGLSFALESPGDLKWFAQLAAASPVPSTRLEAFEISARRLATARASEMTSSLDDVVAELEQLSAASVLCGRGLFALREAESVDGSLSLSELLGHRDYKFEKLIRALPLVSDAGLHRIKLIPEHVQHFLASQWLRKRCGTPADEVLLMDLFRRESFAGPLVPWGLLVCAGWLSCSLPDLRRCLLEVAPHAVLFLGDMAELTHDDGIRAIERTFERLAAGHPLLPNALTLTSDDYWHIAQPRLVPTLVDCFSRTSSNAMCAVHLLKVFAYRRTPSAVPVLREYFAEKAHTSRLQRLCLEALEQCGGKDDIEWAARLELEAKGRSEEIARALACSLVRTGGDESLVVQLCASLNRDEIGLKYHFTDAAESAPDDRALRYASALLLKCGDSFGEWSDVDDDDGDAERAAMAPSPTVALALLRGLLSRETLSGETVDEAIRLLEIVRGLPARNGGYERFDDFPKLTRAIPGFRQKALSALATVIPSDEAYKLLPGDSYLYVEYDEGDRALIAEVQASMEQPAAKALLERLLEYTCHRGTSTAPPKPSTVQEKRQQKLEANRAALEKDINEIRSCADPHKVTRAALLAANARQSSRYGTAAWSLFAKNYGSDIAEAVKAGVKRLWRTHAPLFDANDTNSTYHQTIAGLVGIQLELVAEDAYGRLTPEEATQAFTYAPFEINQFPEWVPGLAKQFPELFDDFVVKAISGWRGSPVARQHATHVLERIARDETLPRSKRIADSVWLAVKEKAWDTPYSLARAVGLASSSSTLLGPDFAEVMADRAKTNWLNDDDLSDFCIWYSAWLKAVPMEALHWLESTKESDEAWKRKAVLLASHWQSADDMFSFATLNLADRCEALSRLYRHLLLAAPPDEDEARPGVHDRNDRYEAARLRDALLGRIANVGGDAAYKALYRLAVRDDVGEYEMRWLHLLAYGVAERAATRPPWTVTQFLEYARHATAPLTDTQSLWKAVRHDVDESVRNLREGDFSPRGLLLQANEKDMQLWLSREIELLSRGRYRVFRERELANGTTPDLTALSVKGHLATLELKLGDSRSLASLLHDLRRQLHDDYMQDRDSNFGLFVVMWRERKDLASRAALVRKVERVRAALQAEAASLCAKAAGMKFVDIRCFICPTDVSLRNEEKAAERSLKKAARKASSRT